MFIACRICSITSLCRAEGLGSVADTVAGMAAIITSSSRRRIGTSVVGEGSIMVGDCDSVLHRRDFCAGALLIGRSQCRAPRPRPILRHFDLPWLTAHGTVLHEDLAVSATLVDVELDGFAAIPAAQWNR